MKRTPLLVFLAIVIALASFPLRAQSSLRGVNMSVRTFEGAPEARPGELVVEFRDGVSEAVQRRAIRDAGGVAARKSAFGERYKVTVDGSMSVAEAVAKLGSMAEVAHVGPNRIYHAFFSPNDPLFSQQWNLSLIHTPRAWDIQQGDPSVVVAVVDTGIAFEDNPPFAKAPDWGNVPFVQGFNVFTGDSHANDDNGHGTNVASIIAEATNNSIGYAGVAFNCGLMAVKVLDATGSGDVFGIAEGIDYARTFTSNGASPVKVINLSLGASKCTDASQCDDTTIGGALDRAFAAGITVVIAAGNDGISAVDFPAAHKNMIAVGAVDNTATLTSYSNFGSALSVVAPGGGCDVNDPLNGFVFTQNYPIDNNGVPISFSQFTFDVGYCGTSQATPHVAAVAALLYHEGITDPATIRSALQAGAQHLGPPGARNDQYGYGLVRPDQSLNGLGLNQ